ncbi:MAG: class I SAM-dependent methyltransferase [Pseudomonadota bacterium]
MSTNTIYQDGSYLQNNPSWHQEHSEWKAAQVLRMLRQNGLRPTTVAEIGCGAGEILSCLATEMGTGMQFSGYDISPQAYNLCSGKERSNLRFKLADLLVEPERFDLALAIDVFEHVEDYRGFLRQFRPKATHKIFHIPLDLSVQTLLRAAPLADLRGTVGHLHFFTKDMALAVLRETGYEIQDWFYTRSSLELQQSWKSRLLTWPRAALFRVCEDFAVRVLGGSSLLVLAK